MKQILYIPSGRYFLWFDPAIKEFDVVPSISSEEVLIKDRIWCISNDMTDIESLITNLTTNYTVFNPYLYKYAGIDNPTDLLISEFEIVEDGK